jgi:hypothetical protein
MRRQLGARLVNGLQRCARQFELAARLQRDRAAAGDVVQADDIRPFHDRLPAEHGPHAFQQRMNAAPALIGHGLAVGQREHELFVFGSDAEFGFRLAA